MDTAEIGVVVGSILTIAFILWFFFGPRTASAAKVGTTGVQEVDVVVLGGYTPDRIEVEQWRPVRLNFLRKESTSCTEQVILGDFGIAKELPKDRTVPVEFTPEKLGEFVFHCGMNMVRGTIVVKPAA